MTLRKKTLWVSALLIMLFMANAFLINKVKAHPTKLYVDPPSIVDYTKTPGSEFAVNIMVDTVTDLSLFQFELTFNPDVIQGVWYDEVMHYPVEVGDFIYSAGGTVIWSPGMGWNNTMGKLWITGAFVLETDPAKCPDTPTPQILAIVRFQVVNKGQTDITLGELTGVMGPEGNWIVKGRAYVEDGSFQNIESAQIPTASFTATPVDTPPEQGPLEGYNAQLDGTGSTATGGKTITTYKWYFWSTAHELFYRWFPSGQSSLVTSQSIVTRNFTLRGAWPLTLTVIDSAGVVGTTTEDVVIKAHDIFFNSITTSALRAEYPLGVPYIDIGETLEVNVNTTNEGNFAETFDVTAFWSGFYGGTLHYGAIETRTGVSLSARSSTVLKFYWDTSGRNITHPGQFAIHANASVVPYEYDKEKTTGKITNNEYVSEGCRIRFHDIAVTTVTPATKTVTPGEIVKVNVTVVNQGDFDEKGISVTAYYNNTLIGTKTVYLLSNSSYGIPPRFPTANHTAKVTFNWDTTDVTAGDYILSAEASVVPAEYDLTDNAYGRPYRPMNTYYAITWDSVDFYVGIVSDSEVSGFVFSKPDKEIRFNVTGTSGQKGYCTIAIPKGLLWGTFTAYLNETGPISYTMAENVTHYFIYLTYEFASTWTVTIRGEYVVPEFPETMILPLLMLVSLIAVVLGKSRATKLRGTRRWRSKQARF